MAAVLLAGVAHATDIDVPVSRAPQTGIVGWGGWIFYSSVILGAVYDDNVYRSQTNRVHDWGTRIIPSFTGEFNDGNSPHHRLRDGRCPVLLREPAGDAVDAKAGFAHIYEAQRDLIFRFSGDICPPGRPVHG